MLTEFQTKKWTHLFNLYDIDKNGVVTREDFEQKVRTVASLHGLAEGSDGFDEMNTQVMADWNHLQADVDKNGDGKISLVEWLAHGHTRISDDNLYDTVKKEVDAIVSLFDKDGNGELGHQEYQDLIKAWGVGTDQVELACEKIGLKADQSLSKGRFGELLEEFHKSDDPSSAGNYIFGSF
jgi:juvenile hormone diol kinase